MGVPSGSRGGEMRPTIVCLCGASTKPTKSADVPYTSCTVERHGRDADALVDLGDALDDAIVAMAEAEGVA